MTTHPDLNLAGRNLHTTISPNGWGEERNLARLLELISSLPELPPRLHRRSAASRGEEGVRRAYLNQQFFPGKNLWVARHGSPPICC
nr:hypothetical protein Itr_chr13CG18880 [Ipomoea trifida]